MTKSSAQLEKEAEQTRSQLAATLEELRSRITPGQLLDQTLDFARESNAGEFVRNLGRDARDNPLPIALIGTGIGWLMMTNGRRRRPDAALIDATNSASGALDVTKPDRAVTAGGSFVAFCREHSLVLGGIGLALGALLGAALPSSEPEGGAASAREHTGGRVEDFVAAQAVVDDFHSVPQATAAETSVVPAAPGEHAEP